MPPQRRFAVRVATDMPLASPGGYRLAAAFEALDSARRAVLGRFVITLMRAQAA